MMPGAGGGVNTTLPLILGIVSMLCCGLAFLLGGVSLIFSIQAGNAKNAGDVETARSKAKLALILAIVGIVVGLIQSIGYTVANYM